MRVTVTITCPPLNNEPCSPTSVSKPVGSDWERKIYLSRKPLKHLDELHAIRFLSNCIYFLICDHSAHLSIGIITTKKLKCRTLVSIYSSFLWLPPSPNIMLCIITSKNFWLVTSKMYINYFRIRPILETSKHISLSVWNGPKISWTTLFIYEKPNLYTPIQLNKNCAL